MNTGMLMKIMQMRDLGQGSQKNATNRKEFCKQNTILLGQAMNYHQHTVCDSGFAEKAVQLKKS